MNGTLTAPRRTVTSDAGFRPSGRSRLSVLLLCDHQHGHANTVLDHIAALVNCAEHEVRVFNPCGMTHSRYLDLNEFDVVVIHYSLMIISDHYLSPHFRERLRQFQGLKIQFVQDEYRWVNDITAMMRYLGIHVLFTLLSPSGVPKVYPESSLPGVVKLTTRAGYVPKNLVGLDTPPIEARPIDIGYRGRTLPYWLGRLAQEKVWIAQGVLARAGKYGLRCDIAWAEQDRIYGQRWTQFLSSCKATLGTESGASITDFDGSIERRTKAYLLEHPRADFHEVHREILAPYEGNARVTAISPRIFEAAALRTAMILFPGDYSGIVQPWIHYIPLQKDFSNMDEVVDRLRDTSFLRMMTEQAYQDLVASGLYQDDVLAREFGEVVSRYGTASGKRQKVRYRLASMGQHCAIAFRTMRAVLEPILRITQALFKAVLALGLLLSSTSGLRVFSLCLARRELRRCLKDVLKDVLKLATVRQALAGQASGRRPFTVSVKFDGGEGRAIFESHPATIPCEDGRGEIMRSMQDGVREGRMRTMVWNHSALGGNVRYRLALGVSVTVYVGDYDIHSFDGFLAVVRRAPEPAAGLLQRLLSTLDGHRACKEVKTSS